MIGLDLGNLVVHLRANTLLFDSALRKAQYRIQALSASITSVGRSMTLRLTLPLLALGGASVKAFASFDDAMTKSLAIFSDMTDEMEVQMRKTAIVLSRETTTSATDLAKGYFYLASAGLNASQSIEALNIVNTFAVAGNFDLAKATELVADSQSAMGLESQNLTEHLANMTRVTDILVGANTLANATTEQFAEALQRAGPLMRQYGVSLEGGIAALAAYAKQGKKGAPGGEMFARMLRLSVKALIDNADAWERLGISLVDVNDKMKPMSQIGYELTRVLDGLGVTARARTLDMLGFQARSQQALFPLLGMGDAVADFEKKLENMGGRALELANRNMQSFSAQIRIVWNNIKATAMQVGDIMAPKLLKLGVGIKKISLWFSGLNKFTKNLIVNIGLLIALIGPGLLIIGLFIKTFGVFVAILSATVSAMVATVGILLTPLGKGLVIILAIIAGVYTLRAAWNNNFNEIKDITRGVFQGILYMYNWLKTKTVNFLKEYASNWFNTEETIGESFKNFIADIAATSVAANIWMSRLIAEWQNFQWKTIAELITGNASIESIKKDIINVWKDSAEVGAQSFVSVWGTSKEWLDKLEAKLNSVWDTAVLYVQAYGVAVTEELDSLLETLRAQLGSDMQWVIDKVEDSVAKIQSLITSDEKGLTPAQVLENEYNKLIQDIRKAAQGVGSKSKGVKFTAVSDVWNNMTKSLTSGEKHQMEMVKSLKNIDTNIEEQNDILNNMEGPVR
jgi:TP901 family phage tail tape measure protein